MPTNSEILTLAPGASYLAANAIAKGQLFPRNKLNPLIPQQIYALYFILNKIHTLDPTNSALTPCCNYLWEIMGKWGIAAQGLSGSGGNVPSPTSSQQYPIYITEADFTSATLYPNTNLLGTNIVVYINELNQYVFNTVGFTVDATGLTMLVPGFDATTFTYNIVIEKVYT